MTPLHYIRPMPYDGNFLVVLVAPRHSVPEDQLDGRYLVKPQPSPNNSSDCPKSAQATKHLGQRFHCKKLHQTAHSHSCERYQRLGFDRAFLVNNGG